MRLLRLLVLTFGLFAFAAPASGQGSIRRVDGLTNMLALNPRAIATGGKATVETSWRDTAGDGGGGIFDWFQGDTTATNVGTVFASTGTPGRWKLRAWNGNARVFGISGDGVTDNTAAFASAVAFLSGGFWDVPAGTVLNRVPEVNLAPVLLLPEGVYKHSGIHLAHQVGIKGYGKRTILKLNAGAETTSITLSNVVGCSIEDLTIDGNWDNNSSTNAHGIAIYSGLYGMPAVRVKDVWIEDVRGAGIYGGSGGLNSFEGIRVARANIGIDLYAMGDSTLRDFDISFCTQHGLRTTFVGNWRISSGKIWANRLGNLNFTTTNLVPLVGTLAADDGAVVLCGKGISIEGVDVQENGSIGVRLGTAKYQLHSSSIQMLIDGNGGFASTNGPSVSADWRRDGFQIVNAHNNYLRLIIDDFRARQGLGRQGRGLVFIGSVPTFANGGNAIQVDNWYRILDVGGGAVFTNLQLSLATKKNAVGDVFQARVLGYGAAIPQSWGTSGTLAAANDKITVHAKIVNQHDQLSGSGLGWQIDTAGPECDINIDDETIAFSRLPGWRFESTGTVTNYATAPVWTIDAGTNGTASGLRINVKNATSSTNGEALFRMQSNGTNWFRVNTENVANHNNTPLSVRVGTNEWQMLLGPHDSAGPGRRALYLPNYTNTAGTVSQAPVFVASLADVTNRVPDSASLLVQTLGHASVGDGYARLYRWFAGDSTAIDGSNVVGSLYGTGRWKALGMPSGVTFSTGEGVTNVSGVLSANLAAGSGISITPGAYGQLTLAATGSGGITNFTVNSTNVTGLTNSSDVTFSIASGIASPQLSEDVTTTTLRVSELVVTNAIPVPVGGTGRSNLTAAAVVVGNGTNAVSLVGPTAKALMGWNDSGTASAITTGVGVTNLGGVLSANLVAGSNISITTGANGAQTIAASGGGGATNGTAVSVDGVYAPAVNLADGSEITVTLSGTNVTAGIANDAVDYGQMQNVSAASRLLGRGSASGSGDVQELTLGTGLAMSGTTLILTNGLTDGYYANGFLPLFAGASNALTGPLHFKKGSDIRVPMWESGTDFEAVGMRAANGIWSVAQYSTNDFSVIETLLEIDPSAKASATNAVTVRNGGFNNLLLVEPNAYFGGAVEIAGDVALGALAKATTASALTSNTTVATTAYVDQAVAAGPGKGYSIQWFTGAGDNPTDSTTYYASGWALAIGSSTTYDLNKVQVPKAGTLKAVYYKCRNSGTLSSAETASHYIRLNNTSDLAQSDFAYSAENSVGAATGLTNVVAAGDYIALKVVTPAWATNPTSCRWAVTLYIE